MKYTISEMKIETAVEISKWVYDGPYSLYSMDGSGETVNEAMNGTYYQVLNESEEVVGYFCFGESAQVPGLRKFGAYSDEGYVDIGLGMRPDLTGKGLGYEFLLKGIEFARDKFNSRRMRLTVAVFNKRAIRTYEKAGFRPWGIFVNNIPTGEIEFMIMKKEF